VGYNYRMSNLLAAFGRAQLGVLPERVAARQAVFAAYQARLAGIEGVELQPEAPWGVHARWLTCILVDPARTGMDREALRLRLHAEGIESRPAWKPMHLQPVHTEHGFPCLGGDVAEEIFVRGLCLPSSSSLTTDEVARICQVILEAVGDA
jgi:dTDP-4-amino-4,6-dideoxygalactose transaminase